ncbi:MAG: terminase small subunit [Oscillospiraceae bacterium]|nr:terminase small subunit [Oscillospiraceae bacterium]
MTDRQKKFAEYFADSLNPEKSAVMAGYSEKTAFLNAQKLLKNPEISKYIQKLSQEKESAAILSARQCRAVLSSIAVDCDSSASEKIKAVGMLVGLNDDNVADKNITINVNYGDYNGN